MKIEEIKKYEGKKVILNTISKFTYKGVITSIKDSSFEFTDIYGNEMTISPEYVGMILPEKEKNGS